MEAQEKHHSVRSILFNPERKEPEEPVHIMELKQNYSPWGYSQTVTEHFTITPPIIPQ